MMIRLNISIGTSLLATALLTTVVSAQNVGIGTTTPKSKLSVNGTTASGGIAVGDASYTSTTGTVAPLNGAIIQGNVGIGVLDPTSKLHVLGDIFRTNAAGTNSFSANTDGGIRLFRGGSYVGGYLDLKNTDAVPFDGRVFAYEGNAGSPPPLTVGKGLAFTTDTGGSVPQMLLESGTGRVGIGTLTPLAPLHVAASSGVVTRGAGNVSTFFSGSSTAISSIDGVYVGQPSVALGGVSIFAQGAITSRSSMWATGFQAAQGFYTASDSRIKDVTGISNKAEDLQTLERIEVTNYKMKDKFTFGDRSFKKVIAQNVEAVYPQAISKIRKAVPDVLQLAKAVGAGKGIFTIALTSAAGLKPGDRVEFLNKDDTPETANIQTVKDNVLTVALRGVKDGESVFVYGHEVDDFRTVDYEALAMLNVSATQELAKRCEELAAKVAALEVENAKFDALAAKMDAMEKSFAAVQGGITVETVALTK